jgi:hypothetical protein
VGNALSQLCLFQDFRFLPEADQRLFLYPERGAYHD